MLQALNLGPPFGAMPIGRPGEADRDIKEFDKDTKSFQDVLKTPINIEAKTIERTKGKKEVLKSDSGKEQKDLNESESTEADSKIKKPSSDVLSSRPGSSVKRAQRNKVMKEFMDSFESKFQIPPTRLVEAMTQLQPVDQIKSAEETADLVVQQLDLDPENESQAQAMYTQFLQKLNNVETQQVPESFQASSTSPLNTDWNRHWLQQNKNMALQESAKNVNQAFKIANPSEASQFVSDQPVSLGLAEQQPILFSDDIDNLGLTTDSQLKMSGGESFNADTEFLPTEAQTVDFPANAKSGDIKSMDVDKAVQKEDRIDDALLAAIPAAYLAKSARKSESDRYEQKAYQDMKSSDEMFLAEPLNSENNPIFEKQFASNDAGMFSQNQQGLDQEALANMQDLNSENVNFQDLNKDIKAIGNGAGKKSAEVLLEKSKLESVTTNPMDSSAVSDTLKGALPKASSLDAPVSPSMTPQIQKAYQEANIKTLMNQAQYLIKKGGGEMKVDLNPEGLGRIQMKVLVQDGRVNVQMAADTKEAKTTLENGLGDLKNSLAAHKLSMDHIKIDVVTAGADVSSSQLQQNTTSNNDGGDKQFNRQFWNQFNQNFGGREQREAFYNVSDPKGYTQNRKSPLQPLSSTSTVDKSSSRYQNKGQGLNLVA
ncbi:MAG: flagellar hook-length control protein FliK [Pseudobdellovibrionaceae bacterium]